MPTLKTLTVLNTSATHLISTSLMRPLTTLTMHAPPITTARTSAYHSRSSTTIIVMATTTIRLILSRLHPLSRTISRLIRSTTQFSTRKLSILSNILCLTPLRRHQAPSHQKDPSLPTCSTMFRLVLSQVLRLLARTSGMAVLVKRSPKTRTVRQR